MALCLQTANSSSNGQGILVQASINKQGQIVLVVRLVRGIICGYWDKDCKKVEPTFIEYENAKYLVFKNILE